MVLALEGKEIMTVDIDAGVVLPVGGFSPVFQFMPTATEDVPIPVTATATGRAVTVEVRDDGRVYQMDMNIGASDNPSGDERDKRTVVLEMELGVDSLMYSPALVEDQIVTIPFTEFDLFDDQIYVPLANGLIGVGADLWLLKYCRSVHTAARISYDDGKYMLQFIDETVPPGEQGSRRFYLLKGTAADAIQFARLMNTHPNLVLISSTVEF